jgi:hypothetical protein
MDEPPLDLMLIEGSIVGWSYDPAVKLAIIQVNLPPAILTVIRNFTTGLFQH